MKSFHDSNLNMLSLSFGSAKQNPFTKLARSTIFKEFNNTCTAYIKKKERRNANSVAGFKSSWQIGPAMH
jgi:hypothetical protein